MVQYCFLLEGLDGATLRANTTDFGSLQDFLHKLCVRAYYKKREKAIEMINVRASEVGQDPDAVWRQVERTTMLTNID